MGGDCLNTGVAFKALLKSARVAPGARVRGTYGIGRGKSRFSARIRGHHCDEPHDSIERYNGLGVECLTGMRALSTWSMSPRPMAAVARRQAFVIDRCCTRRAIPALASNIDSETLWARKRPARSSACGRRRWVGLAGHSAAGQSGDPIEADRLMLRKMRAAALVTLRRGDEPDIRPRFVRKQRWSKRRAALP
jgi:hypothetical protein